MRVSFAKWVPAHGVDDGPRDQRKALLLHTAVTGATDLGFPDPNRPGVGCHFYLLLNGDLHQYLDTSRMSGHAWDANPWTLGLESQDNAVEMAWTQSQLDTIDKLCRELGVPGQALKETPSDGIGYHRQFNSWNQSRHSCPTDPKVAQIAGIIARLAAPPPLPPEEDDVGKLSGQERDGIAGMWGFQRRQKQGATSKPNAGDYKDGDGADRTDSAKAGWEIADKLLAP